MVVEREKVGINRQYQWPQEPIQGLLPPFTTAPSSSTAAAAMVHHHQVDDHHNPSPPPPPPALLKCPRCDSSNTKFCYYNNYSLSQPRHFCKACKRYWTRGGTLRNVPVGGGCRKNNKRHHRPNNKTSSSSSSSASVAPSSSSNLPNIPTTPAETSSAFNSNLFYNMPTAADMSLAFPSSSLRPYDIPLDALSGLGFTTSTQFGAEICGHLSSDYQQQFGSRLVSSLRQQQPNLPYEEDLQHKEVKVEGDYSSSIATANRVEECWQLPSHHEYNSYEATMAAAAAPSADHSSSFLYWNVPGWPDAAAANCGSSIAPLI